MDVHRRLSITGTRAILDTIVARNSRGNLLPLYPTIPATVNQFSKQAWAQSSVVSGFHCNRVLGPQPLLCCLSLLG
jgi:hypothetical protein